MASGAGAVPAQGAAPEPDFVLLFPLLPPPPPANPPQKNPLHVEGPCGLAVAPTSVAAPAGNLFVSNYYRHSIESIVPSAGGAIYLTVLSKVDPLDGPCGLALDTAGRLYVNNYHRNVERYAYASGSFGPPTTIASSNPTGVAVDPATNNVYVNARTHIAVYDSSGAPVLDAGDPLEVGTGSLGNGYGIAISQFPATLGRLYVPDHSDDTVKVYDPLIDKDDPVQVIPGPPDGFGSLRDSAVAVDRLTGEIYVVDTGGPQFSERPEAVVRVFGPSGAYTGRLKYAVVDGSPPGLAVDNTNTATKGRVYVTSGNTASPSIYAYPPGSVTNQSAPATFSLSVRSEGNGSVAAGTGGIDCSSHCEAQVRSGSRISLAASPEPGSAFMGWSGAGCAGAGECEVTMSQARSVTAEFRTLPGPPAPTASGADSARGTTASQSVVSQKGNLRVTVSGKLAPKRLPRAGTAPISVSVGGEISTTDQSLPPQLKAMRIELNRNGRLDYAGLSSCAYDRIQPGSSSRALAACRASLVGEGSFTANITLAGQEPYPTKGKLLVFIGAQDGKPVLFGHIYAPKPFSTSFVLVFRIQKLGKGTYGTALDAPLPKAMDAWGRLTGLQMTLSRRYSVAGERRSFISAGCPAPKGFTTAVFPLARTSFSFEGGRKLDSVLTSTCKTKG